ncbi:MAG: hypothetical protein NWE93_04540 [Candidatus Bathyarchaeota archaeon]|nr:hypothetical protein [Candidatus Bathyarchaeota archaeon]
MDDFARSIEEYKRQLKAGAIQKAYRGIMDYTMSLRIHFERQHPDLAVSGSIYFGYMDMTYFALVPEPLKQRKLKIAIVFLHEPFRFEVWLAGANKAVQKKYWALIKKSGEAKYRIPSAVEGNDSIVESILVENPDFSDPDQLTLQIEEAALRFIDEIEEFLSKN